MTPTIQRHKRDPHIPDKIDTTNSAVSFFVQVTNWKVRRQLSRKRRIRFRTTSRCKSSLVIP